MTTQCIPASSSTPQSFPSENTLKLLLNISQILLETIAINEKKTSEKPHVSQENVTSFDAVSKPSISLNDFLVRIMRFSYCSNEMLVIALMYIERISKKNRGFLVDNRKIHRLIFIAIIIAIKFHEDRYYTNEYYAKVGGVRLKELNLMEKEFLFYINYELFIEEERFRSFEETVKGRRLVIKAQKK